MTSHKFDSKLTTLFHAKMAVVFTSLHPVSQKYTLPSPYLHDVIYKCSSLTPYTRVLHDNAHFPTTNSKISYFCRVSRSAQDGYDFNSINVIQWISMLQDLYEKFDYNDLDCQKRLICEVMREPEYYGAVAQKFKSGFQ